MKKIGIAVVLQATALAAFAEPQSWAKSGEWEVLVDPDAYHACYAEKTFPDGVVVQIGAVPEKNGGYFAAYHADWTDIEDGSTGSLIFDFGDVKFGGEVQGRVRGGLHGGYAFFDNPDFTSEFGKRNSVSVTGEAGRVVEVSLAGSMKAIAMVKDCQKEQPKPEIEPKPEDS